MDKLPYIHLKRTITDYICVCAKWMHLKCIMLSERNQIQKAIRILYESRYDIGAKTKLQRQKINQWLRRTRVNGDVDYKEAQGKFGGQWWNYFIPWFWLTAYMSKLAELYTLKGWILVYVNLSEKVGETLIKSLLSFLIFVYLGYNYCNSNAALSLLSLCLSHRNQTEL